VLGAAFLPVAATAQQAGKIYRIGVLALEVLPPGLLEAFQAELRTLGYVEGKNLAIESRNAGGKGERLTAVADELIRSPVDIILAVNTPAAQAAKKATATLPIVMMRVSNPVKSGLVASLARPGGNITGLSVMAEALSAKQLQLLKEVLAGISHVAVLWYAGNPGSALAADEMGPASSRLGLELLRLPLHGPSDFPGAFEAARRGRAEALIVIDDALITQHRVEIIDLAARNALPVVSLYKPFAEAGGLLAYGPNAPAMYRRAAQYVDRILKGARPNDLPIEQPTKFDLFINLKTAAALGLTIPTTILERADEVIE
jgi:putative ABC transport system substrate-binding protein